MPLTQPEFAPIALRLEVEEPDGVEQVGLALGRLLLDVLVGQVERVHTRLQRFRRNVFGALKVLHILDNLNLKTIPRVREGNENLTILTNQFIDYVNNFSNIWKS